jgi:hypothetical protein
MSLEERIGRLEAIQEIHQLLIAYGRTLDARDFEGYSRLFARDGTWTGGFGSASSPAGILAMLEKSLGKTGDALPSGSHHLMTNFSIEPAGEEAKAWSRWSFVVGDAEGKPVILYSGQYDDVLVREDGRWRFKSRTVTGDLPRPKP